MQIQFNTNLCKTELAEDGGMYLVGVASSTRLDQHKERMAPSAIQDMAKGMVGVPLTDSHDAKLTNIIGRVENTHVTDDSKLVIKARIDEEDPEAVRLFNKVRKGYRAAFSVGGMVAGWTHDATSRRVITKVDCSPDAKGHICLTNNPANPDTFAEAIAKSLDAIESDEFAKAADISDAEREKHATYFEVENGKKVGKFPIFDKASAESALHLVGHAPADKQNLIREKACAILGDSHEACKQVNKEVNSNMTIDELMQVAQDELAKEGKTLSADTMGKLMEIKQKLESLMGIATEDADGDGDGNSEDVIGAEPSAAEQTDPKGPEIDVPYNKESKAQIAALFKEIIATEVLPVLKAERKSLVSEENTLRKTAAEQFSEASDINSVRSLLYKKLSGME